MALAPYSKLGFFPIDSYDTLIRELKASPPRVFKSGDPGLLKAVYQELGPGVLYIARNFGEVDDMGRWDSGRILTSPKDAAKYWVDAFLPAIQLAPFAYWESFNEMSNWAWMKQYGLFEAERQRLLALANYKACIGNFSTGSPPIKPDQDDPWVLFYPALEACNEYRNLLGLHEYGGLWMDLFFGPNSREAVLANKRVALPQSYDEGWLFGRYRKVWNTHIYPNAWLNIRIVLTELGLDRAGTDVIDALAEKPIGPWSQCMEFWASHDGRSDGARYYFEMLRWVDYQMRLDPYMMGCTIFCRGAKSNVWLQWDVRGQAGALLDEYNQQNHPGVSHKVVLPREGLYLRLYPSRNASPIAVLPYGNYVKVSTDLGGWSHVITEKGQTGYSMSNWLGAIR